MGLRGLYAFCRPWAVAEAPAPNSGSKAPVAPFAIENSAKNTQSTSKSSYNNGWSKDVTIRSNSVPAAGGRGEYKDPHSSVETIGCLQHGGQVHFDGIMSAYQSASDSKALARHHRHDEKTRQLPVDAREVRWYKCFRQLEGGWGSKEESISRVTGTDFSVLPAGYVPKSGMIPQLKRRTVGKYEAEVGEGGAPPPEPPAPEKAAVTTQRPRPQTAAPVNAHGAEAAWVSWRPANEVNVLSLEGDGREGTMLKAGDGSFSRFSAWRNAAARERNNAKKKAQKKNGPRPAEYIKLKQGPRGMAWGDLQAFAGR
jgi:hypothetical protein